MAAAEYAIGWVILGYKKCSFFLLFLYLAKLVGVNARNNRFQVIVFRGGVFKFDVKLFQ